MKILLVNAELGYRGTPRTLANYARMLAPCHDVAIWGYCEGGETADVLRKEGFCVFIGEMDRARAFGFRPDVVNLHRPGLYNKIETEMLLAFKQQGARCVETNVFGRYDSSLKGLLDVSLQISGWDLYRWNVWKGTARMRGVYFPNPVNTDLFVRASDSERIKMRRKWGVAEGDFVIGRIGKTNWAIVKDPILHVLESHPNVHLISVDDYCGRAPNQLFSHPRVHVQSRLAGEKALTAFYSACNVCLNVSPNGESFGYVNAESMACGTPVVTLSTPLHDNAQVEMVRNGEGGIVAGSARNLCRALNILISDSTLYEKVSRRCRDLILSRYSFEVLSRRLQVIFEGVQACRQTEEEYGVIADAKGISRMLANVLGGTPFVVLALMRFYHSSSGYAIVRLLAAAKRMILKQLLTRHNNA